jgi:hypothetical protein
MAPCMSSILALSVSDKIDQYGAYAGFASVLGLAVLSLLYFAQAREVKRLREWAGRSPERDAELQQRAVAAAQQRAIVSPPRPATPVGAPTPAVAPGVRPAAATPAGQAQGAPAVAPAAAAAATAAGAATATPGAPAVPAGADGPGQPTTAMPAANGGVPPTATPTPAASPGGRVPGIPGQPLRVPGSATPPPSRLSEPEDEHGSRLAVFGAIGAIVVVAIVAVVLLTGALGGGDTQTQTPNTIGTPSADSGAGSSPTKTTGAKSTTPAAAPAPGSYTVAVLNGTTVPGLARGVANRLQNTKFKIGNVTNAATQDRSATLVEFAAGHRAEADAVAKAIEVGRDAIQPLSPGSKTIAGDQATVVVTVGSDQNTSPQTQTTP